MKTTITALALAAAALPSMAADWAIAYHASNADQLTLVDLASVKRVGNIVTFWVSGYSTPNPKTEIANLVGRYRVDCAERTLNIEMTVAYLKNGEVKSVEADSPRMTPLIPGSMGERRAEVACAPDFPVKFDEKTVMKIAPMQPEQIASHWFNVTKSPK